MKKSIKVSFAPYAPPVRSHSAPLLEESESPSSPHSPPLWAPELWDQPKSPTDARVRAVLQAFQERNPIEEILADSKSKMENRLEAIKDYDWDHLDEECGSLTPLALSVRTILEK